LTQVRINVQQIYNSNCNCCTTTTTTTITIITVIIVIIIIIIICISIIIEKLIVAQLVKIFHVFIKPEGSSQCSKELDDDDDTTE
jgi:hypothetical protein